MRPCAGTISFEHSIGVSVRATTPEKKIAAASVMREFAEQLAGIAGHERQRHEHRHQRRGGGDDGEDRSRARREATASSGGSPSSIAPCTFSISTMASSTTMPMAAPWRAVSAR